jgi:hypothetical protein
MSGRLHAEALAGTSLSCPLPDIVSRAEKLALKSHLRSYRSSAMSQLRVYLEWADSASYLHIQKGPDLPHRCPVKATQRGIYNPRPGALLGAACKLQASSAQFGKEVVQGNAQNLRQQAEIENRQVPLAALHRADERAVEMAAIAEVGLRPLAGEPVLTEAETQVPEEFAVVKVHA